MGDVDEVVVVACEVAEEIDSDLLGAAAPGMPFDSRAFTINPAAMLASGRRCDLSFTVAADFGEAVSAYWADAVDSADLVYCTWAWYFLGHAGTGPVADGSSARGPIVGSSLGASDSGGRSWERDLLWAADSFIVLSD